MLIWILIHSVDVSRKQHVPFLSIIPIFLILAEVEGHNIFTSLHFSSNMYVAGACFSADVFTVNGN